jgi:beta-N-acetylhexosaminidase
MSRARALSICALALSILACASVVSRQGGSALPDPETVVGQNFIVGIPAPILDKETVEFLEEMRPGGIILYRQANIEDREQLSRLIAGLQDLAVKTTGAPYLIFIDEEPGGASRLDLFKGFSADGKHDWPSIERDMKELRAIGINVLLAPVADVPSGKNSFISPRSQIRDVQGLTAFNRRFIGIAKADGVATTLKHFPGLGSFSEDPHRAVVDGDVASSTIERSLGVFEDGIGAGASFVMTNHGIYENIDPGESATFSKKIVGILRGELGFKGIIITDDISSMPFASKGALSIPEAALKALDAGHTMALFSWDQKKALDARRLALEKYESDPAVTARLDSNYGTILAYKHQYLMQAGAP